MTGALDFIAVAIGFALIGFGVSPLVHAPGTRKADVGCAMVVSGIVVVALITAIKVLS